MHQGLHNNRNIFLDVVNAMKALAQLRESHKPIVSPVFSSLFLGEHKVDNFDDRFQNTIVANRSHYSH